MGYAKRAVPSEWDAEPVNRDLVLATHEPSRDSFYVRTDLWDRFYAGDPTAAREMQAYLEARSTARKQAEAGLRSPGATSHL